MRTVGVVVCANHTTPCTIATTIATIAGAKATAARAKAIAGTATMATIIAAAIVAAATDGTATGALVDPLSFEEERGSPLVSGLKPGDSSVLRRYCSTPTRPCRREVQPRLRPVLCPRSCIVRPRCFVRVLEGSKVVLLAVVLDRCGRVRRPFSAVPPAIGPGKGRRSSASGPVTTL
jgi:hypothetical protein